MGKTFGVRLHEEAAAALEREALRRGMKPTTLARELLVEALSGGGEAAIAGRLEALETAMVRFEHDLPERLALSVAHTLAPRAPVDELPSSSANRFRGGGEGLAAWVNGG